MPTPQFCDRHYRMLALSIKFIICLKGKCTFEMFLFPLNAIHGHSDDDIIFFLSGKKTDKRYDDFVQNSPNTVQMYHGGRCRTDKYVVRMYLNFMQ